MLLSIVVPLSGRTPEHRKELAALSSRVWIQQNVFFVAPVSSPLSTELVNAEGDIHIHEFFPCERSLPIEVV